MAYYSSDPRLQTGASDAADSLASFPESMTPRLALFGFIPTVKCIFIGGRPVFVCFGSESESESESASESESESESKSESESESASVGNRCQLVSC